ncbi:MAG: selenocysteine-specific translation elongation factor [Armatimonadaceae bacterium]
MESAKHVIIGTAGHVDHGKTTLIRALTGIDTDRLQEEKARGMTIDLGFAFLELSAEPPIFAGIVDVPGHERFVKNMLAGAGGIDVALVVVAAEEGPMPQTREHLDILTVLDVEHGVVALTKSDLADEDLRELAMEATREALAETPLADAPIIAVSAETGAGMAELKAALAQAAAQVAPRDARAPFRLPIDRVFSLAGVGTVVTGTLVSGTLRVGDAITVLPQGLTTRARTIQAHNRRMDEATAGMRVAVNLPGIEVGEIERGAVLCSPGTLQPTTLSDVQIRLLPDAPRPLRHRERVRVHLGTGETLARLLLLEEYEVAPGATDVPAQLLFEAPVAPARGERFVLRTYSPMRAVGGGKVLEPVSARRYRRGDAAARMLFEARGTGEVSNTVYAALAARHEDFSPAEVATATGLEEALVSVALESLADEERVVALPNGKYFSAESAQRLRDTAHRTLATYHQRNPLRKTMPRDSLRTPLSKAAAIRDFATLLEWLIGEGVLVAEENGGLHLPDHEVVVPPGWKKPAAEILEVYRAARFLPPSPDNFQANYPRDVNVRAILTILSENGQIIPLNETVFLSAEAFAEAKALLRKLAKTPEGISVATVRDATGSSRKVILPLMEYFDAQRITRRQGDLRVLIESAPTPEQTPEAASQDTENP